MFHSLWLKNMIWHFLRVPTVTTHSLKNWTMDLDLEEQSKACSYFKTNKYTILQKQILKPQAKKMKRKIWICIRNTKIPHMYVYSTVMGLFTFLINHELMAEFQWIKSIIAKILAFHFSYWIQIKFMHLQQQVNNNFFICILSLSAFLSVFLFLNRKT